MSLASQRSQAEADAKKKDIVNKKKAAMLAKMKKKQSSFIVPPTIKAKSEMPQAQPQMNKA